MKEFNDIYYLLEEIIPKEASKSIAYLEIEEKSYEMFFYSYFENDIYKQCFELEAEGIINGKVLSEVFEKIDKLLKNSSEFDSTKRNVITVTIENNSRSMSIEKYDKSIGLYKLKKSWKEQYLLNNKEQ